MNEQLARQNLDALLKKYHALTEQEHDQLTETEVVRMFIEPLLEQVLGWPTHDVKRFRREYSTKSGRPDLMLEPEHGGILFVEAKKFGMIGDLKQIARVVGSNTITPTQMALPGMATDRTREEQQAINYAFKNDGTWAILTNFEKLRLFNARRDWLVLSFENPYAYRDDFDLLWQLSYPNILNGSLDVLSNQRHREEVDTAYLQFINEWRQRLAQDIVNHPRLNPWAFETDGKLKLRLLRKVVQRYLDRLVLLRFAEDHLVIPPGTMREMYELRRTNPYTFSMTEFLARFFRRFDEAHNSALFAPDMTDHAMLSDDALMPLITKLYEARYRAMLADILGNTYEQYLGKTLVQRGSNIETADNLETRKKQGSYYTPQVIVRYVVDNSLGRYLYGTDNGRPDGNPLEPRKTSREILSLRVLDSACGSGSFLIYAYYVLQEFYRLEMQRLDDERLAQTNDLLRQGLDLIEIQIQTAPLQIEKERIQNYHRLILETHLYGVDLDPQAAEIAVVNLMMRALEGRHQEKRLPLILNQNVKVGNSLVGLRPTADLDSHVIAELRRLRRDLVNTPHGAEHDRILQDLERLTSDHKNQLDAGFAPQFTDLERVSPFHWGLEFPEVFYDEHGQLLDNGGFDVIFGNPPWEILKPDLREFYAQFDEAIESRLSRAQAERRITELQAEDPARVELYTTQTATITQSAAFFRASPDYTRQGRGDTATHKLFMERMYAHLLKQGGRLGYVVPSGIYTDLGTKDLREMLLNEGQIQYIFSFSNERFFFPGVDHRFKFALIGAQKGVTSDGFWAAFRFNPRVAIAPDDLPEFLANPQNLIYMRLESLARFNPDSLGVMEFQNRRDYDVVEKIYDSWKFLGDTVDNQWNVVLNREFDFANDRQLLNQRQKGIPFYEGKMINQYDAFYAPPKFWISDDKVAILSEAQQQQIKTYRVVHRRIARTTDERTLIAAIVPPNTACENNATTVLINGNSEQKAKIYVCALFNSFVLDYLIRYKISATLNMFYIYSLPVPRLMPGHSYFDAIVQRAARLVCTRAEFADLWQSVMGDSDDSPLHLWGGVGGGDTVGGGVEAERQHLRDEIDALVAHLYGLSVSDFAHILGTFPLVFPSDDAGRRKKEALLEVFESFDLTP